MSEHYIDDFDTSVVYDGAWTSSTSVQRSHNHTLHSTNSTNSKVTLTFTGIRIKVFGVIRAQETSESSYSLDGGDPAFYRTTAGVLTIYPLFYTSPIVGDGQHNLTVENLGNELFIDYFNVTTSGVSTNSSTFTSTGTIGPSSSNLSSSSSVTTTLVALSSSGSSTAFGDVPPTSTGKSTDANPPPNNTASTHHTGAIVGAIAALAIIAIFCLWLRRRRRQENSEGWMISPFSAARAASSFLPTQAPPTDERPTHPLQPPAYPLTEPPTYHSAIGPAVQVTDAQLLCSSRDVKR